MATVDRGVQTHPARVFLSYKRHVEPDQTLAGEVVVALETAGHTVFIDQRLTVGQAWAKEIETQVHQADYLIVFLTADSSRSEMVRGEIEMARHHAATTSHPRILPVRVNFDGPLPYPLNAYLDSVQYATWRGAGDTQRLLAQLLDAITGAAQSDMRSDPAAPVSLVDLPPPYAAPLPVPGGTLDVDDPWYLPRPTDATALSVVRQPGQTLTIKGPRQMGKSSLLMRTVKAGLDVGKRVALLDFQLVDEKSKADADLFFRRFASSIAEQLDLPDEVDESWDSGFGQSAELLSLRGAAESCSRSTVRASSPSTRPIQSSARRSRATSSPCCAAGTGCGRHPIRRSWKNLDIILSTSTEPQFFIDRPHESPFNVGVVLPLEDFLPDQVAAPQRPAPRPLGAGDVQRALRARLRASLPDAEGPLHGWRAAPRPARSTSCSRTPSTTSGPFGDHLRYYLLRLQGKPELIAMLRRGRSTATAAATSC